MPTKTSYFIRSLLLITLLSSSQYAIALTYEEIEKLCMGSDDGDCNKQRPCMGPPCGTAEKKESDQVPCYIDGVRHRNYKTNPWCYTDYP